MKALLDFFRSILFTSPRSSQGKMSIHVRCERCGEALKAEIHLQNDLSVTYGDRPSNDRYHLHKTITGSKMCFQRIELNLEFDARKQLIAEEIVGGTRIDKSEFDQAIEDQTEQN